MATLLTHTSARHVMFIGDQYQLQPLGAGSPFRDIIGSGVIPTIHLTENYRTNCLGIRMLCDDIRNGTVSTEQLPEYLSLGGVFYVPCDHRARPFMVAKHYTDLVDAGLPPNNIRVLAPHNIGDRGTKSINIEVRKEIKFPPDTLVVGDILLITENDYEALCSAGGDTVIFNGELCEVTLGATSSTWNLSQIAMGSGASACH
jgi:ATP-dependent exoDNAse (exonuclease V) alpha subunit